MSVVSVNPIVVAPNHEMGRVWVDENRHRFTRRPQIRTQEHALRGLSNRDIVLIGGCSRPPRDFGGHPTPPILVSVPVQREIEYLEDLHGCTVERVWLP